MFIIYKNLIKINKYFFITIALSLMIFNIATPSVQSSTTQELAQKYKKGFFGLNGVAKNSGFETANLDETPKNNIATIIGQVIGIALSFLGIIFMMLIVYGGFAWMMARGNETESQKAKDILINASIGVIVVFSAFALSEYIITQLYTATQTLEGS